MINDGVVRSFSQGSERLWKEAGFSHGLGEYSNEECAAAYFVNVFEEMVVADLDLFEELLPPSPAPSSLFLCLVFRAL